jgi:hypothetical protein
MDGNIKDTPPIIVVPRAEDQPRWQMISSQLEETRHLGETRKKAARPEFQQWLAEANPEAVAGSIPSDRLQLHAPLNEGKGNRITLEVDDEPRSIELPAGSGWDAGHVAARAFKKGPGRPIEVADAGDFDRNQAFSYGAWVRLPTARGTGAVLARMDDRNAYRGWDLWVEDGRFGVHIIHKWPGDVIKVGCQNRVKAGEWNHVFVSYDGSGRAAGVKLYLNGVPQDFRPGTINGLTNTIRTQVPLTIGQRHKSAAIANLTLQDVRVYARALTMAEVERLVRGTRAAWVVSKPADKRSAAEVNELFDWWLPMMDKGYQVLDARLSALKAEEVTFRSHGTIAHVMQERPAEAMAYLLFRGDYDKRRDPVHPETPHALPAWPADLPKNRLGFAKWLLRPEQPLTARVTVNRFWQELFGTGIVRTSGDFGVAGELPSHPELLDWLAVELRESGWDVKQFFKLLVTSATYRQAAITTPQKREKDPHNRLLSRGPRFRMDAEMIRDYALASSGLLVRKVGGPSVKPYQPEGVWEAVAMIGSNTRDYKRDSGENLYRRSMYTFWKRSAPPASMDIFNAPSRETCSVRRERTNTPLQALVTLNDPQFVEAARQLAQTALKEGGEKTESRIDFIARRLLARPFRPDEMKVVQASLSDLITYYQSKPDDAKKLVAVGESKADAALDAPNLAAWTMLVNELMNLDEVLNK